MYRIFDETEDVGVVTGSSSLQGSFWLQSQMQQREAKYGLHV